MSFNVFISYRYTDAEIARTVTSFFQPQGGRCQGRATFAYTPDTSGGETAIKAHIAAVMRTCAAVLLVVGDDSHNGPWIEYEIDLARGMQLPLVAVKLPGTTGNVPNRIRNSAGIPLVVWSQDALCDALNAAANKR